MLGALVSQVARALVSVDEHLREGAVGPAAVAALDEGEEVAPLDLPSSHLGSGAPSAPSIALDNVGVTTHDAQSIVSGVSLRIASGEYVALVGPSGAGKSTLLRLMAGLVLPSLGQVRIDGHRLCRAQASAMRRVTGFVTQDCRLFDRPLFENVAYRAGLSTETLPGDGPIKAEFLRVTSLAEVPETLGVAGLSGGERQRVNIARALWGRPPLLLLDEPTAALDALIEARILARLAHERAGATCVVVAHRLAAIRHADRIVVMEGGRIVETGDHVSLLRHGGLYARMWHAQQAETSADIRHTVPEPA